MNEFVVSFAIAPLAASVALAEPILDPQIINDATYVESNTDVQATEGPDVVVLKLQILLDRAHFSPGVIDGRMGENVQRALYAFEERSGLAADGKLDQQAWKMLESNNAKALEIYELTEEDVNGPFVETIPEDYAAMAQMKRLSYTGPVELLSEKFHMDTDLLKGLNPNAKMTEPGEKIIVANVGDPAQDSEVDHIEVDKSRGVVRGYAPGGVLLVFYPATIGSDGNPSPSGTMRVKGVARNPDYSYKPEEHAGRHGDKPLTLPPGPNGPVGSKWIELTKETYGIHGTPQPELVGKTASQGCVRLTNWDAEELARLVKPGTSVTFIE